jgi:hypothetical protein
MDGQIHTPGADMTKPLEYRISKLERAISGGVDGECFYISWVNNPDLIAEETKRIRSTLIESIPAYCFCWRGDGPIPQSRITTPERLSDAELKFLGEELARTVAARPPKDGEPNAIESRSAAASKLSELSDRKLMGIALPLLSGACGVRNITARRTSALKRERTRPIP